MTEESDFQRVGISSYLVYEIFPTKSKQQEEQHTKATEHVMMISSNVIIR